MRCPKCGFIGYDYLENCIKCNADLAEEKRRLNLPGYRPQPISLQELQDRPSLIAQKEKEQGREPVTQKSKLPGPSTESQIVLEKGFSLDLSSPFAPKKTSTEPGGISPLGDKDLELTLEGLEINIKPNDNS